MTSLKEQDRLKEIDFFNRFTQDGDYDSLTNYGYHSLENAFKFFLKPHWPHIHDAIDLGCGTGSFTRHFLKRPGIRAFGVDIAATPIQRASEKNDGIKYFVSDIGQLGIKDASMDLVIFSGVLHHFPTLTSCLKEAYRILKKDGMLVSYDPHGKNPCMWLYRHPRSPLYSASGKTENERLLHAEEMRDELKNAGFAQIKTKAIGGVAVSYLESPVARFFLPLYNALEILWGLSPLAKTSGSFLIAYARKE